MTSRPAVPIVVGVGDVKNRSRKVEDAIEPLLLILQAIRTAVQDTGLNGPAASELVSSIDSFSTVQSWTWPYPDIISLLAQELEIKPTYTNYTDLGANQPVKVFDDAARQISKRQSKVAVVSGGEALASLSACVAAGKMPPSGWTKVDDQVDSVFSPTTTKLALNLGTIHSIGAPIHVYPLYENAFRAHRRQSLQQNNWESAQLYANFADVAEKNPYAWNYGKHDTVDSIGTVSSQNRMICYPYPLLMNAFNTVNLASACILTSTEYAAKLGIPKSQWIYPLGAAGTQDSSEFWKRPNFYSSPSLSRSIDAALEVSGLRKDEIDLYDFYSCFPIIPKLAADHLGLPITDASRPLTTLGGLTSFGGPGNNYSMHALTEVVRQLRAGKGRNGLILANGGFATYQHVVCLSASPRKDANTYPLKNPLPKEITDVPAPVVDVQADGEATIETYTVEFNRDGTPLRAYIVGLLKNTGHRFLANHGDDYTLLELAGSEGQDDPIGRSGVVQKDKTTKDGPNLFRLQRRARL